MLTFELPTREQKQFSERLKLLKAEIYDKNKRIAELEKELSELNDKYIKLWNAASS